MNVERPANRARRGGAIATVAWLTVLGGTVALGVAGRESGDDRTTVITPMPSRATPVALPDVARRPLRSPIPTRPPIGEDGIMGGLPFGTAWQWLESD